MFLLNSLRRADIVFFSLCIGAVVIAIAIYFLIPIIRRKQYEERRQNLKKREETFRANLKNLQPERITVEEVEIKEESSNITEEESVKEEISNPEIENNDNNQTVE